MLKKALSLLLTLCLLLPCAALATEKLPTFQFANINDVAYLGANWGLTVAVKRAGGASSVYDVELRDDTGRVWATKTYRYGNTQLTFKVKIDESHLGGHNLSVWYGDEKLTNRELYLAVTDKHQKAVQKVETDQPMMAITFDCAYVDTPTDEILSILDEYGIKCTFFMTGEFLINYPESARKIRDAGHEIGCHSLSHPHLLSYALNMRFKQVRRNVELVRSTLGVTPRLFRPPFGEFDATISAPARAEGMEICLWTIDSKDWDWNTKADAVLRRVQKDITPGTIILFHLDGYFTPEVIRQAIPYYMDTLGLRLVPVTELMAAGGLTLPPSPYETANEAE